MPSWWDADLSLAAYEAALLLRSRVTAEGGDVDGFEPHCAEFVAALAAGVRARRSLQVGGSGLCVASLAAAARITRGHHVCASREPDVVTSTVTALGLAEHVTVVRGNGRRLRQAMQDQALDFALLLDDCQDFVTLFDALQLRERAVVVANQALLPAADEYLQHVRSQPGVDSYTLPIGNGLEVTWIIDGEQFSLGRKRASSTLQQQQRRGSPIKALGDQPEGLPQELSSQATQTCSQPTARTLFPHIPLDTAVAFADGSTALIKGFEMQEPPVVHAEPELTAGSCGADMVDARQAQPRWSAWTPGHDGGCSCQLEPSCPSSCQAATSNMTGQSSGTSTSAANEAQLAICDGPIELGFGLALASVESTAVPSTAACKASLDSSPARGDPGNVAITLTEKAGAAGGSSTDVFMLSPLTVAAGG
eukprot:SM000071S21093  [mRNA]  locus=s71:355591:357583:- [translate_table: standard]